MPRRLNYSSRVHNSKNNLTSVRRDPRRKIFKCGLLLAWLGRSDIDPGSWKVSYRRPAVNKDSYLRYGVRAPVLWFSFHWGDGSNYDRAFNISWNFPPEFIAAKSSVALLTCKLRPLETSMFVRRLAKFSPAFCLCSVFKIYSHDPGQFVLVRAFRCLER